MAYVRQLPSGNWQATIRHPSGRRFTKTDPLKKVVQTWAMEQELRIRRGLTLDPNAGKMPLGEWRDRRMAARPLELATRRKVDSQWRNHIAPTFATWPLSSIQRWDLESWVADLAGRGVGATTIGSAFRQLSQLLGDAVRDQVIPLNPAEGIKLPRAAGHVDRFLDREEARHLLGGFAEGDRLFVQVLLYLGLRWAEAAALGPNRVDLRRGRLRVQEALRRDGSVKPIPKSRAGQREVPLTTALEAALRDHMAVLPAGSVFLFPGKDGRPIDYSNWRTRVWLPALTSAGLAAPQPTPHDLRHTYGMWLADGGVPAHQIRDLMGHASILAVERYLHASEARHERARAVLEE